MNYPAKKLADVFSATKTRHKRAISCPMGRRLTAMSGLSARTSSWGGDGARLVRGGDATGGGAFSFVAFLAYGREEVSRTREAMIGSRTVLDGGARRMVQRMSPTIHDSLGGSSMPDTEDHEPG